MPSINTINVNKWCDKIRFILIKQIISKWYINCLTRVIKWLQSLFETKNKETPTIYGNLLYINLIAFGVVNEKSRKASIRQWFQNLKIERELGPSALQLYRQFKWKNFKYELHAERNFPLRVVCYWKVVLLRLNNAVHGSSRFARKSQLFSIIFLLLKTFKDGLWKRCITYSKETG